MIRLSTYHRKTAQLADFLPWAGMVARGIVLNKDGSFQRTASFRGPDLESATTAELIQTTARLNNAFKRLGSGWAIFVEADRTPAAPYPRSSFPEPLSWLIEEERTSQFASTPQFESHYYVTLLFLPPPERAEHVRRWMMATHSPTAINWREQLEGFVIATDRVFSLLEGVLPDIRWLDDAQSLTYLHGTISAHRQSIAVPETPFHLDALLADCPLSGGLSPMLGGQHLKVLTVKGFPNSTWPGMLDELNRLAFPYRWMTRFIALDKTDAEGQLVKLRRQWFAKRKSIVALLRETLYQQESPLIDPDAANQSADAEQALSDLGTDAVAFGFLTSTVIVMDEDEAVAHDQLRQIERVIQGRGLITMAESFNAVEGWLSSIPGHVYANVRQPMVSTLNLSHLLPLSAVWAGPIHNTHLVGPPLLTARTDGSTPFRLVTHVGDVGHTLIVGPTGAGKSVLLSMMLMQFRRYPPSQVFAFDAGGSLRASVLGLAGDHQDLDTQIAFQPLARLDEEAELLWASDWVAGLLAQERLDLTPEVKDALWSALVSLSSAPAQERTLTGLSVLLQSNALRLALAPYTFSGPYGRLLDADRENLGSSSIQCFEMASLMHLPAAAFAVLTYLFHRLGDRFNGAPTLLILDEAWMFLDHALFAARIREWLKTLRKKNVSVVFATQSLSDIARSSIAPAIIESCASRIFLPSPQAQEPQLRATYEGFGLNARQIELISQATPKRDYYYQSRNGARLFDLAVGPVAHAFAGASSPEDHREMDALVRSSSTESFAEAWLQHKNLPWAADLLRQYPSLGDPR